MQIVNQRNYTQSSLLAVKLRFTSKNKKQKPVAVLSIVINLVSKIKFKHLCGLCSTNYKLNHIIQFYEHVNNLPEYCQNTNDNSDHVNYCFLGMQKCSTQSKLTKLISNKQISL